MGFTVGSAIEEVKPAGTEVHVYVYIPEPPLANALSCTIAPAHVIEGIATGDEFNAPPLTMIVTVDRFEQDVDVDVAVKVNTVV